MSYGIFQIFNTIAASMDDIATMSKVATKQTIGVLGDDLAVNASKASTFSASRELPVIWAITKGSFINKVIIIPIMILFSYYFPQLITPILILGGIYLSYEGAHAIWNYIFPHDEQNSKQISEKAKIKSAIFTDFILSLEIVLIALSAVVKETLIVKIAVVTIVSILATIGVYGLVAFFVRLDDMGFLLIQNAKEGSFKFKFGKFLISLLPKLIKTLSIVGIFAMLLVAGGIFMHNIEISHEISKIFLMPTLFAELLSAIVVGGVAMIFIDAIPTLFKKLLPN